MNSSTQPERDRRVMAVVEGALQRPVAERQTYLRLVCANDPDFFHEVTDAVAWEERLGSFLRKPFITFETFQRPFKESDVVGPDGRYEIIREVGEGGMSVVYEAFDRARDTRIAIKVPKIGFRRNVPPELNTALKMRHPNLCVVNDVHFAETDCGRVDFLTMEFLEGETLAARMHDRGKLPLDEAYEIARQLCAGLAEVHRNAIIHRDFKPANIILAPNDEGGVRPVITDFGIAREITLYSGELGGTPRYMAPELWRGESASRASDIYSLGLVLYEMVAGCHPVAELAIEQRLTRKPAPPSKFAPGLPSRWDRTILRCLDPDPEKRPTDALEVLRGLEKPVRHYAAVAAFAVLLIVAVMSFIPQVRNTIAAWFKLSDVRLAILPADAPADMTATASGILHDVGQRISHMRRGDATVVVIPSTDALANNATTAERAATLLHATHALQVKLVSNGDQVSVEAHLVDLATMTPLQDFAGHYTKSDLGDVPRALTGTASSALRLKGQATADTLSANATAAYDRGLYYLRGTRYSFNDAVREFQDAAHADPHSAMPLAGLTEAYVQKFQTTKDGSAIQDAQKSLEAAQAINPDSVAVHLAGGLLNQTLGKYEKALEEYRRVLELEPRNVDALLRSGRAYESADMNDKALDCYRHAVAMDGAYYEPHLWFGAYYFRRGDYTNAATEFRLATDNAPGLYDAFTNLGSILQLLWRDAEAEQALRKALQLKETARALNALGSLLNFENRDIEAAALYDRAVSLEPTNYVYWINVGDTSRRLRQTAKSQAAYLKVSDLTTAELRQNPRLPRARCFQAYAKAQLGEAGVEELLADALNSASGDNQVLRCVILTDQAMHDRNSLFNHLQNASPQLRLELSRHPDLADLRRDPRFQQLMATK